MFQPRFIQNSWRYYFSAFIPLFLLLQMPFSLFAMPNTYLPHLQDKTQFDIAWMGPLSDSYQDQRLGEEAIVLRTNDRETYKCIMPQLLDDEKVNRNILTGTAPEELLSNILSGNTKCSYRLEPYWTYEVCHGSFVRQFHEEKDGEGVTKLQEFYLGNSRKGGDQKVNDALKNDGTEEASKEQGQGKGPRKVQTMNIDGRLTPFYSQVIGNGTPCDLNNGQPRQVKMVYICHPSSNNEVMSVKETTTCEYEVIILNPNLCENSAFKVKDEPVHQIRCHSLDGSPSRPTVLIDHEVDSAVDQFPYEIRAETTESHLHKEGHQLSQSTDKDLLKGETATEDTQKAPDTADDSGDQSVPQENVGGDLEVDNQLTKEFLEGEYCLHGGSGWWKYEFCYGKYISQYHEDESKKSTIFLGYWDAETHLDWIKQKKRVKGTKYIIHYYSNGDMCDLTGKPRNAQVKLKCKKSRQGQEMSIYLLEPSPCEYIVVVESPVLCPLISRADGNALIDYHY